MKQLADGVWQLGGFPPNAINVYLLDDVLIDAATRYATRRITRQLEGHQLSAHALTHAHPDHQGASHAICERYGVPFWVGEADVPAAENPKLIGERQPDHFMAQLFARTMTGPGHRVDRVLREGDEVGSFRVLDTPGHSAGHVSFWRESDRILVLGDVLNAADVYTASRGCASHAGTSRPIRPRTAVPLAVSGRWSRAWSSSGTDRRCATRASSSSSAPPCRTDSGERRRVAGRRVRAILEL
jgi:hydroxyacylglutathione hydrolase